MLLSNVTLANLNFTKSCDRAAKIFIDYVSHAPDDQVVADIALLLNQVVGDIGNYTFQEIENWYTLSEKPLRGEYFFYMTPFYQSVRRECLSEICIQLAPKGNPDLAGIGVFYAYCLELSFLILFLSFFAASAIFRQRYPSRMNLLLFTEHPLFAAVLSSFCVFYDSASIFSIGVSISTLIISRTNPSSYDQSFDYFGLYIAVCIPLALWPIFHPICSQPKQRRALLNATIFVLIATLSRSKPKRIMQDGLHSYCTRSTGILEENYFHFMLFFIFTIPYTIIRLLTYIIGLLYYPWAAELGKPFGPARILLVFPCLLFTASTNPAEFICSQYKVTRGYLIQICNGIATSYFITLLSILVYHYAIQRYNYSAIVPDAFAQDEWGIGQVLALITWLPTIVELYCIIQGRFLGYRWRIPAGLDVGDEKK